MVRLPKVDFGTEATRASQGLYEGCTRARRGARIRPKPGVASARGIPSQQRDKSKMESKEMRAIDGGVVDDEKNVPETTTSNQMAKEQKDPERMTLSGVKLNVLTLAYVLFMFSPLEAIANYGFVASV